jgi:hypothetical protein
MSSWKWSRTGISGAVASCKPLAASYNLKIAGYVLFRFYLKLAAQSLQQKSPVSAGLFC